MTKSVMLGKKITSLLIVVCLLASVGLVGCGKIAKQMGIRVLAAYYPDGMIMGNVTIRPISGVNYEIGEEGFGTYKSSVQFICVNERPETVSTFEIYNGAGVKLGEFSVPPFRLKARKLKSFIVEVPSQCFQGPYKAIIR